MTEDYYIDYFTNMAVAVKAISHNPATHNAFFVIEDMENIQEVQQAIRDKIKTPALLLECFEDDLTDMGHDNNLEILHGAIAVIVKVSQGNAIDRRAARKTARAIAKVIVIKMKSDGMTGVLCNDGIIVKLQSKGFPIGPIADNCYGWRYTFTWYSSLNTAENSEDFNT